MAARPRIVALILPPVPAYSRELTEGVIERRNAKRPWRLVDLPHLRIGRSPLPSTGVNLDGAIVWADRRDRWIEDLVGKGVKVVNCGSDWLGVPGVATVRAQLKDAGDAVVAHFNGLGFHDMVMAGHLLHKRPVMLRMLESFAAGARRSGMKAQIWEIGGKDDPGDSPKRLFETEKERRLMELLRGLSTPTGIFCESDHMGVIVCRVAALVGLRVPEDIAIAGYGDNLVARFSDPPLTSISPSGQAIGRTAASTLSRWMDTGEAPPPDQIIGGMALMARESTVGRSGSLELERVRRRIASHAARGLTVTDLLSLSGFSVKTLVRRYSQAFGIDPSEEIRRIRLSEAKNQLLNTNLPVSEIATSCGFSSQAGFYNYFVRHAGQSPSDFRAERTTEGAGKRAEESPGGDDPRGRLDPAHTSVMALGKRHDRK